MRKVTGFYEPHERSSDFYGTETNHITGEVTQPPSMTKQEFLHECDINNIVKEYSITGQISHIHAQAAQGAFVDLPDPVDLQTSMNMVINAQAAFAALPAGIRDRFENDPLRFVAFVDDEKNYDEAVKLGLIPEPAQPSGGEATPTPPAKPDSAA